MYLRRVISYVSPIFRVGVARMFLMTNLITPQSRHYICIPPKVSLRKRKPFSFGSSKYKYYSDQSKSCWKCDSSVELHELFCRGCNSIQKLDPNRNYFDLFGVGQTYNVDLKVLHNSFRNLQRLLHPDLFSNKDEEEKKLSEEHSSLVNKAYSTLTHPVRRGLYMLRLKGIDIEEAPINMSQDFLVDIMERNEEVNDLKDVQKIRQLSHVYKNIMLELMEEVKRAFNEEDLEKVKETVAKMKYFSNLEMKLKDLKQELAIVD
ncbi:iron-sulfur cluster co-chaperone protein HscB [Hetaerina americana]|uniref:iron-sulfur cluster co-chaperone protein HscB n=1 Tax=Hetaerina americana TaxID=62018 RepID=UPI003A7F0F4D